MSDRYVLDCASCRELPGGCPTPDDCSIVRATYKRKLPIHRYESGVTDPDRDGWSYGLYPPEDGDGRKLVTLEQHGMVWVGIRHWQSALKRWVNNGEPISETVIAWKDLPQPAEHRFVSGILT